MDTEPDQLNGTHTQSRHASASRMSGSWGDAVFASLLVVIAAVIVVDSISLGVWVRLGPGPGFLPLVLGTVLGVLALTWLWQLFRARHGGPEQQPPVEMVGFDEEEKPLHLRQVAIIVGSLIALAILMPLIGFQLAMLLFLVFHLRFLGRRRWWLTIVISVIGSFGVFVLFTRVLSVKLPTASIEFLRLMGF